MKNSIFKRLTMIALIFTLTPAFARDEANEGCAPDLLTPLVESRARLTLEKAQEIVGFSDVTHVRPQMLRAANYVASLKDTGFVRKTMDLDTLMKAIRQNQWFVFEYKAITTDYGSRVYVGERGHFIFVNRLGEVYFGNTLDPQIFETGKWTGSPQTMQLIKGN